MTPSKKFIKKSIKALPVIFLCVCFAFSALLLHQNIVGKSDISEAAYLSLSNDNLLDLEGNNGHD